MTMTCWKTLLTKAMQCHNETFSDIVANTMSDKEMTKKFDDNFGRVNGCPFTVWTSTRVYFPVQYDGAEKVSSISRNPDGKATDHVGGG